MKKDLITIQEPVITEAKDEATLLISQAIDKGVTVETMEKLLAMRKDLKQERAKEEFDRAMAGFQSECPTIQKKTQGYNYKYADLTTIVEQIKGILAKYGFSYTFDTDDVENTIVVSCKVKHISGHMEVSKATITRETTTKMNASQQSGAAMTYGKRYAFVNAFGLLTGDEDTDAVIHQPMQQTPNLPKPSAPQTPSKSVMYISDKQKGMIQAQLKRLGKDMDWLEAGLRVRYNVGDYHELSITDASKVIEGLLKMKDEQTEEPEITDEDMDVIDKQTPNF